MIKNNIFVSLVCGFLEAGKTTYINNEIKNKHIDKILIICCESGNASYDIGSNVFIKQIEYLDDFSQTSFIKIEKEIMPDCIYIELNGMWQINNLKKLLPTHWSIHDITTIIDTKTFSLYYKNLHLLMNDKLKNSNKIIFNNANEQLVDYLRKLNLCLINNNAKIFLQYEDFLKPFSIAYIPKEFSNKSFTIDDNYYVNWFYDFNEHPSPYIDKTISFRGQFLKPSNYRPDQFVVGRNIMTCCKADEVFLGMLCCGNFIFLENTWVKIQGKISINTANPQLAPYILECSNIEITTPIIDSMF